MADVIRLEAPFALPRRVTEPDLLAKYFQVLSDVTRVRILELLRDRGELSVGELVRALEQSQPKVSNHLACLRWCGFVQTRRDHPRVLYRIADPRVAELLGLGRALLADNAEHVAACRRVDGNGS
jgi:DNA-binding transcriptional ArsR family regulator